MQRVSILCVGKLKEKFYMDAAAEYQKRLSRHCDRRYDCPNESRPGVTSSLLTPKDAVQRTALALAREAAAIRAKLPPSAVLAALCVEGRMRSSEELARRMDRWAGSGESHLVFLIGGSFGLDPSLKAQAKLRLSMSPMTFPHHLARVMLLEQLYRAFKIREGSSYHK